MVVYVVFAYNIIMLQKVTALLIVLYTALIALYIRAFVVTYSSSKGILLLALILFLLILFLCLYSVVRERSLSFKAVQLYFFLETAVFYFIFSFLVSWENYMNEIDRINSNELSLLTVDPLSPVYFFNLNLKKTTLLFFVLSAVLYLLLFFFKPSWSFSKKRIFLSVIIFISFYVAYLFLRASGLFIF